MTIAEISQEFLSKIQDATIKSLFMVLLNTVESQNKTIKEFKEENQRLKDEIARLKGEKGRPAFSKKKQAPTPSLSSEQERKEKKRVRL